MRETSHIAGPWVIGSLTLAALVALAGLAQLRSGTPVALLALAGALVLTFLLGTMWRRPPRVPNATTGPPLDALARVGHELRTPLSGIIGMANLLLATRLDDRQRDHAAAVRQSAEALLRIVNDLLDASQLETGNLRLAIEDFAPRALLEDVAELLAPLAHRKGLRIASRTAPDVPEWLQGDPGRIRQVLINLAGNAVKFTDAGEVLLEARRTSATDSDARIRLSVRDTGPGVPLDRQADIFEPFTRLEGGARREGAGLGLTICKRLVDLMGGRIGLESRPGAGGTFWMDLTLPIAESPAPPERPALGGRRALLVGTDATQRAILAEMLQGWGCEVTTAATASEAPGRGDRSFDVVFVDQTQVESGMDLQDLLHDGALVLVRPLGALSRVDPPGAAVLTTPARRSSLINIVRKVLNGETRAAQECPTAKPEDTPSLPGRRVLIAEDDDVNRRVTERMLQSWGCEVQTVSDGAQAVREAAREAFDAVLMDLEMPVMDGLDAVAAIRRAEGGARRTPIIAVTAHERDDVRQRCLDAGCDDCLSKPIRPARLLAVLTRHASDRMGPGHPTFRPDALNDLCGDDRPGAREIIASARSEFPRRIDQLHEALADRDAPRLRRAAHALKGACATIGADALGEISRMLEATARAGDVDGATGLVARATSGWGRLEVEFDRFLATPLVEEGLDSPAQPIFGKSGAGLPAMSSAVTCNEAVRGGVSASR